MVVSRKRGPSLNLEFTNSFLDLSFVHPDYIVMCVLNAQRFRKRNDQVFFIQLCVTLDCFVLEARTKASVRDRSNPSV